MTTRTHSKEPIYVGVGETLNVTANFGPASTASDAEQGALGHGETLSTIVSALQTTPVSGTQLTINSTARNTGGSYVDGDSLRASNTCVLVNMTVGGSATADNAPHVLTITVTTSAGNTLVRHFDVVVEA